MPVSVEVPARAYALACDPRANAVPEQELWPAPLRRRTLRGEVFVYPGETAPAIVAHLRNLGRALARDVEPATRAEGRLLMRAADRLDRHGPARHGRGVGMLHAGSFQRG